MRVMDSHLHLWDPDVLTYEWLDGARGGRFAEDELIEEKLDGVCEEAAIFVQAAPIESQTIDEVRWVDRVALPTGVVAIVAGARLDRGAETDAHLEELAEFDRVVGVRHLLQDEPEGFALTDSFLRGARQLASRGWTFDACVRAHQLSDVTALAASVPDLPIVLDHLGKPAIGWATSPMPPSAEWVRDLTALAQHPQVYCKLSGLPAETGGVWTDAQIEPFLDAVLAAFGPERLMWGSDWPVSSFDVVGRLDSGDYVPRSRQRWFFTVANWAERRRVDPGALFWDNALAFYGIR